MQRLVRRGAGLHAEERLANAAGLDLGLGGGTHVQQLEVHAQADAGQRVVAVQHHMLGVDLGHGVDGIKRHAFGLGAFWQAFHLHANVDTIGEEAARLEADQVGVVVTEGFVGVEREAGLEANLLAFQSCFDLGKQIIPAVQEFHGLGQFVDQLTLGVFESPAQGDNTGAGHLHGQDHRLGTMTGMIDIDVPTPLLGGLSPATFMRRHWHKKPLLVRGAVPPVSPVTPQDMARLAASEDVESRLVSAFEGRWRLRHGPIARLPARSKPGWTLLVQGLDQHVPAAREMLDAFRFVPEARLDDLMVSYASDGGGVGPHFDSYDVFLIQVAGQRRWRIGRQPDAQLKPNLPLRIIENFAPEAEFLLGPGDMLYLPPRWAHDGVAVGDGCMTASVGFRAGTQAELAAELLSRLEPARATAERRYADPGQPAVQAPGEVPAALQAFAREAVEAALAAPHALDQALGEWLTEPKPRVWFDAGGDWQPGQGIKLDRRSRMLFDARHVFLNGESYLSRGRDAQIMRKLANERCLSARELQRLSPGAQELVSQWAEAGWLHGEVA